MSSAKKILFLDRDGVINIDHGYVYQPQNIEFIHGIFELCKAAQMLGYEIVIITNQSGIARGLYSENDFLTLMEWIKTQFNKQGINILDIYHCPHHPSKGFPPFVGECDCRKPKPGMILSAIKQHNVNPEQSYFIGDKATDMQAAYKANIKHLLLFNTSAHINEQLNKLMPELRVKVQGVTALSDVIIQN